LKQNHQYYYQVQLQMKLRGKLYQYYYQLYLKCLTGKVDNNTGRIFPLAGLSRFDNQVWRLVGIRLAGIQVACGSSQALEQVLFHYSIFIVLPHLLHQDLFRFSYGFG